MPNFKRIGGGPWKNGQKSDDLTWNDPEVKMSKCCFDPFKIHKKKVIALICVITKVYLQRQSNVSLENGKKDQSSEKH